MNKIKISAKIIFLFIFLFLISFYAFGQTWNEPSANPPAGNVGPPLNTTSASQIKIGKLGIGISSFSDLQPNYALTVGTPAGSNKSIYAQGDICTALGGGICLSSVSGDASKWSLYPALQDVNFQDPKGNNWGLLNVKSIQGALAPGATPGGWNIDTQAQWQSGTHNQTEAEDGWLRLANVVGGSFKTSWYRTYDSGKTDHFSDIACGPDESIVIVGETSSNGSYKPLILRYDRNGNLIYANTTSSDPNDPAISATFDKDGNLIVLYQNTIKKLNPANATLIWSKKLSDIIPDTGWSFGVKTDSQGNIIFTKGQTLVKLDGNGNLVWQKIAGAKLLALAIDHLDNIVIVNYISPSSRLLKYNSAGVLLYDVGGISGIGSGIAIDSQNNIFVASFDTASVYIYKYNSNGTWIKNTLFSAIAEWNRITGSGNFDNLASDGADNIIVTIGKVSKKFNNNLELLEETNYGPGRTPGSICITPSAAYAVALPTYNFNEDITLILYAGAITQYYPSGTYYSAPHDFATAVSYKNFKANSQLNQGSVNVKLEVSDNGFVTIKGTKNITLQDGLTTTSISDLPAARWIRATITLSSPDSARTPKVDYILVETNAESFRVVDFLGSSITGVSKLTVGTIDPVFKINGNLYASYMLESIGPKVQVTAKGQLKEGKWEKDLAKEPEGSDLWLFWQIVEPESITIQLTPRDKASLYGDLIGSTLIVGLKDGDPNSRFDFTLTGQRLDFANLSPEEINLVKEKVWPYIDIEALRN